MLLVNIYAIHCQYIHCQYDTEYVLCKEENIYFPTYMSHTAIVNGVFERSFKHQNNISKVHVYPELRMNSSLSPLCMCIPEFSVKKNAQADVRA